MRKVFVILLMVLISPFLFAESIWYQQTTEDALNVFDMNNVYYLPMRSSTWGSNDSYNGTINSNNYIGQMGSGDCSHRITFKVETSGRFVSQSDPTKYREFCVAMSPRYNYLGTDYGLFYDVLANTATNSTDRAPNTKATGVATVTLPKTNNSRVYVANKTQRIISRSWIDIVICMDALTSDDLKHIQATDDYIATVTFSWSCAESNCRTASHSGTYTFTLRGYFGTSDASQDAVYMFVNPIASSSNMSIKGVIRSGEERISDIQIHTTTRTDNSRYALTTGRCGGYEWKDHVFAFISASSDYMNSNSEGFFLKKRINGSVGIPYQLTVYNSNGTVNRVYDGTQAYTGSTASEKRQYSIDLGSYITSTDRYGNTYNSIDWYGYVTLKIPNGEEILSNPNGVYSGYYDSYVYYHIIYE